MNSQSIYEGDLLNEFNSEQFYAQPKTTSLMVTFIDRNNKEIIHKIGNAVVANIEEANEKIPVYSYNSDIFKKYLKGKKVITGTLILTKTTVDQFLSLAIEEIFDDKKIKKNSDKIKLIEELKKNTTSQNQLKHLDSYRGKLIVEKETIQTDSKYRKIEILSKKDGLLYFLDENTNSKIKFHMSFEGQYKDTEIVATDVLFIKKRIEVNIHKSDVLEIYSFIANPAEID